MSDTTPQPPEPRLTAPEPQPAAPQPVAPAAPVGPAPELAPRHVAAPEPGAYPPAFYLSAPTPPRPHGNRRFGMLIVLVAAIGYVAIDAVAVYLALDVLYSARSGEAFLEVYLQSWSFWLPFAVFVLSFVALVGIVGRGGWWAYVLGALFVAALVFAAFIAAALVSVHAWQFSYADAVDFLHVHLQPNVPYAWASFLSALVALEVVTWAGLWIAAHGAAVTRRNAEARAAFEQGFGATGPVPPAPGSSFGA